MDGVGPPPRVDNLLDNVPAVVFARAPTDGAVVFVNEEIRQLLGFSPREWYANPALWEQQIHPADRQTVVDKRQRCYRTGTTFRGEYRIFDRDGEVRWVREGSRSVNGTDPMVHGLAIDVTDWMWSGDVVGRLYEEQSSIVSDLNRIRDRLETFMRLMAHDVRAPLSGVHEAVSDLAGGAGGYAERDELLAVVGDRVRQVETMMDRILSLERMARADGEAADDATETVGIREFVLDAVESIDCSSHEVRVEVGDGTMTTRPALVEHLLRNLIWNAITHTPPQTEVVIGAGKTRNGVVLSVEDDGPGIPEEVMDVIFEPFERGVAADTTAGLGLGLSLVKGVAELLGGSVRAESQVGAGTRFEVFLPQPGEVDTPSGGLTNEG